MYIIHCPSFSFSPAKKEEGNKRKIPQTMVMVCFTKVYVNTFTPLTVK